MVLLGREENQGFTCLLFRNVSNNNDNNVYVSFPLHAFNIVRKKIKIQLLGGPNNQLQSPVYVKANVLPVKNPFLDQCLAVLEDPSIINNTPSLTEVIKAVFSNEKTSMNNTNAELVSSNNNGIVNIDTVKILNQNFFIGSTLKKCTIDNLPKPGMILIDEDAKKNLSGSVLIQNNKVIGIVSMGSTPDENKNTSSIHSKCIAIKLFHSYPWMKQCCDAVFRYTQNSLEKIKSLGNVSIMKTLEDDTTPVILNYGVHLTNYYYGNSNRRTNSVRIWNLHHFLNITENLKPNTIQKHDSIKIETILNTNTEFIDHFYSDQQDTTHYIVGITYTDVISGQLVNIDYENQSLDSNHNDWCFRGDKQASLELMIQTYKKENNDTETAFSKRKFSFNPKPTSDLIYGENYQRQTSEVCGAHFNDMNTFNLIHKNTFSYCLDKSLKDIKYNYLWNEDDSQYCFAFVDAVLCVL